MKQGFNLISVLCEKKRFPLFQFGSISVSWLEWISHPRILDRLPLTFFIDFGEVKELEKKKKALIVSLGGEGKSRETLGVLSEVSAETSMIGVDYPILGNSKSYGGTIFFYSLVVTLMVELLIGEKKMSTRGLVSFFKKKPKWKN